MIEPIRLYAVLLNVETTEASMVRLGHGQPN